MRRTGRVYRSVKRGKSGRRMQFHRAAATSSNFAMPRSAWAVPASAPSPFMWSGLPGRNGQDGEDGQDGQDGSDFPGSAMESPGNDGSDSNGGRKSMTKKHIVRSHFPETWLFQLRPVDRQGKADVSMKAPDTLTSWTAEAVCMSSKAGIGLAQPARILVKKVILC